MRPAQVLMGAIVAIALAGGGFAAGMTVAQGRTTTAAPASASPDAARQGAQLRGGAGAGAAAQFGGALNGRVISVNADSITVEVRQPGAAGAGTTTSTIALVGQNTRVVRTTETDIKLADIKANEQVTIIGQPDQTTGTVAANAIIVGGNALGQLFGGAGQSGAPRPSASGTPRPSASP